MFKSILVPLDGSATAEMALPFVEEIATNVNAEVILVSISDKADRRMQHLYQSYLDRVTQKMQHELDQLGTREDVRVSSRILSGNPADEILQYADEGDMDCIAMASRGSSSHGLWPLGSIAAKVLRATVRPVLLIRSPATAEALQQKKLMKRILLPLDGSVLGEAAIPYAEYLALNSGAELILYQVIEVSTTDVAMDYPPPYRSVVDRKSDPKAFEEVSYHSEGMEDTAAFAKAYLDGMGKRLREKGINASMVIDFGAPADRIVYYAGTKGIDLIAMSTHGRSGVARWFAGSVSDKVIHAGDTAVLVVRPPKENPSISAGN